MSSAHEMRAVGYPVSLFCPPWVLTSGDIRESTLVPHPGSPGRRWTVVIWTQFQDLFQCPHSPSCKLHPELRYSSGNQCPSSQLHPLLHASLHPPNQCSSVWHQNSLSVVCVGLMHLISSAKVSLNTPSLNPNRESCGPNKLL